MENGDISRNGDHEEIKSLRNALSICRGMLSVPKEVKFDDVDENIIFSTKASLFRAWHEKMEMEYPDKIISRPVILFYDEENNLINSINLGLIDKKIEKNERSIGKLSICINELCHSVTFIADGTVMKIFDSNGDENFLKSLNYVVKDMADMGYEIELISCPKINFTSDAGEGYCLAYSLYFIEYMMINSDITPEELVKYLIIIPDLKKKIVKYGKFLQKLAE